MKKVFIPFVIIVIVIGCKKDISQQEQISYATDDNNASAKHGRLQIGDTYAGGIIFYFTDILHNHGRVCSVKDIGQLPWDMTIFDPQNPLNYNPRYVGETDTSRSSGAANTTDIIITERRGNYAALKCRAYRGGGHWDWSLPSKDELNLIYKNIKLKGFSSFSNENLSYYWSSSEIDNKAVWSQRFDSGIQVNFAWKNNIMNIRATRGF